MKPIVWQTLQLLIVISPFWFLAANLKDGDEAVKSLVAVVLAVAVKTFGSIKGE